jgi:hypothetical protein
MTLAVIVAVTLFVPTAVSASSPLNCGSAHSPYAPRWFLYPTRIAGGGFGCSILREAAVTYVGAPYGCVTSRNCAQSGIDSLRHSYVDCVRVRAHVSCDVYVGRRSGWETFWLRGRGFGLHFT